MSLKIGNRRIDDPKNIFVVAELSGNHGQSYKQAERLVAAAAEAGANAIKVQTFEPEEICADIPLPLGKNTEADAWFTKLGVTRMRELFSKGGFPRKWHKRLRNFAVRQGVEFLSTPFSVSAARFLVEEVGVHALKIASGDLTFKPLLIYAATRSDVPILWSTGGATLDEIYETATSVLYRPLANGRLAIFHCVSIYPCPDVYANLNAIKAIKQRFDVLPTTIPKPVMGWSDHTLSSILVPALAISCGATVIEKHIRLANDTTSVDVGHSLDPQEFGRMVREIRHTVNTLGELTKEPQAGEMHDRLWARRGKDGLRPTDEARAGQWE